MGKKEKEKKQNEDAKEVKQRFEKIERVGEGTYGEVYKARDLTNNQIIALKKIKIDSDDEGMPSTAMREISILRHINHVNIVKYITN